MLGMKALGVDTDRWACQTARAAGHDRLRADVTALDPKGFGKVWGLVGSPPCQAYSTAGKGLGKLDKPLLIACAHELAAGNDSRRAWLEGCRDPRSLLTVEPLRYALALRPRWIALEQVPAVLELWSLFAGLLGVCGYHTAAGVLSAERYGVPQTRKRAFLIASLDGPVQLPAPTHRSYNARRLGVRDDERGLLPWVSMASALGWTRERRAVCPPTQARGVRSGRWVWRNSTQPHACVRRLDRPAPTIVAQDQAAWTHARPATTVACDPRIHPGGHKQNAADPPGRYHQHRGADAVRVTVCQAAVLQGFRPDYPWQGRRSSQFVQIGNAVPPPLARQVVEQAIAASPANRRQHGRQA